MPVLYENVCIIRECLYYTRMPVLLENACITRELKENACIIEKACIIRECLYYREGLYYKRMTVL